MLLQRRAFLTGLGSLLAAPMVVRAENLMPVRSIERLFLPAFNFDSFDDHINLDVRYQWVDAAMKDLIYGSGWSPVPAVRYNKQFKITGDGIEYGGCTLMQKTKLAVENSRGKEIQAARDLANGWQRRYAEFSPRITRAGHPVDPTKLDEL